MFEKLKVPLPYTWEIFGDFQVDYHDCFKMFNPVTKAQFDVSLVANAAVAWCRFSSMPGWWVSICTDQKGCSLACIAVGHVGDYQRVAQSHIPPN